MARCTHLDSVKVTDLPDAVDGCEDCLATGGQWLHLRICLECGHVGCCDSSPNQHASAHARETGHQLIRSRLSRGGVRSSTGTSDGFSTDAARALFRPNVRSYRGRRRGVVKSEERPGCPSSRPPRPATTSRL